MIINFRLLIISLIISFSFLSCSNSSENNNPDLKISKNQIKENLIKANKKLNFIEEEEIDQFEKRNPDLKLIKTNSGLRYYIYSKGDLIKADSGDLIELSYSLKLINGIEIYNSKNDGNKSFIVGIGSIESGLNELSLYLHQNDKVKAIIPSYLAYGMMGDDKKIPKKATLIYDIKVEKLIKK